MKKVVLGIMAIFMALSFACGSCFLIEKYLPASTETTTEETDNDPISAQASGYWTTSSSYRAIGQNGSGINVGSASNPWVINSAAGLASFAYAVNNNGTCTTINNYQTVSARNAYVVLTSDIDVSDHYWVPIGTKTNPFNGTFDGQGHTISGVYINDISNTTYYQRIYEGQYTDGGMFNRNDHDYYSISLGLFGTVSRAEIDSFELSGSISLNVNIQEMIYYIGGVAGNLISSDLTNVTTDDFNIYFTNTTTRNNMTVTGAWWDFGVDSFVNRNYWNSYVGGLVGQSTSSDILYCHNRSSSFNASSSSKLWAGGVVGNVSGGSLTNCSNYASVTVDLTNNNTKLSELYAGGVVGYNNGTTNFCSNFGNFLFAGDICYTNTEDLYDPYPWYFGGVVGYSGTTTNCYNHGDFTSYTPTAEFGGVVGRTGSVSYCGNFGDLYWWVGNNCVYDGYYGGVVGHAYDDVVDCVNYGDISSAYSLSTYYQWSLLLHYGYVGGIVGSAERFVNRCINYGDVKSGGVRVGEIVGYSGGVYIGENVYTSSIVYNCVNYGDCDDAYDDFVIISSGGYIKSYSVNASRSSERPKETIEFFNTSSNWNSGNYRGFSYNSTRYISTTYTTSVSSYSSNPWYITPLVDLYQSSLTSNLSVDYSLVPMSAVSRGQIRMYWQRSSSDENLNSINNSEVNDIANAYIKQYSSGSITNVKSEYFYFLRGADYSYLSRDPGFYIKVNQNFSVSNFVMIDPYSFEEKSCEYRLSASRFVPEMSEISYATSRSVSTIVFRLELVSKEKNGINIQYGLKTRGPILGIGINEYTPTTSSVVGTATFTSPTTALGYQDEVSMTVTPNVGYKLVSIATLATIIPNSKFSISYPNSSTTEMLGNAYVNFNYNFESTIYLVFEKVKYEVNTHFEWGNSDEGSNLIQEDNDITVDSTLTYLTNFNINHNTSGNKFADLGYVYKIYFVDMNSSTNFADFSTSDDTLVATYAPSSGLVISSNGTYVTSVSYSLSIEDLIDSMSSKMVNNSSTINLYVTREAINYQFSVRNYANDFKGFNEFEVASFGGTTEIFAEGSDISDNLFNVEQHPNLELAFTPNELYSFERATYVGGTSLSENSAYMIDGVSAKTVGTVSRQTVSLRNLLFDAYVKLENNSFELAQFLNGEIQICSFYQLGTYQAYMTTYLEGSDGFFDSAENYPLQFKTESVASSDETADFVPAGSSQDTRYTAPIILQAEEEFAYGGKNYRFVGYYMGTASGNANNWSYGFSENDKLLSNKTTYIFDVSDNTTQALVIYARYEEYATDGVVPTVERGTYYISSAENLIWLSNQVKNGNNFAGTSFVQTADIDMSDVANFEPIGTEETPFSGSYNGGNFLIENLTLNSNTLGYVGLFGCTDGATIFNLTLYGGSVSGYAYVGGLVGYAKDTTFQNVGNHSCKINLTDVYFSDLLTGNTANSYLLSYTMSQNAEGKLEISYSTASFDLQLNFGGLVGYAENCSFSTSYSRAEVDMNALATNLNYIAGLVGNVDANTTFDQSFYENSTNITSNDKNYNNFANGLAVDNAQNCYARSGSTTYFYNALEADGEIYSGTTPSTLNSQIWLNMGAKYVLKVFYWS